MSIDVIGAIRNIFSRIGAPAGASVSADIAAIETLVDDLEGAVGAIEGATTLHNKLTAARAALLDQITALRLAELDPANIPADVDALLAGGLTRGLVYYGVVTAVPGANQFTIPSLAGLGAGKFADATAPYWAFVLRDAGGASAQPQGSMMAITVYDTATGVFTTGAFIAAVAAGDEILIIHPEIAKIRQNYTWLQLLTTNYTAARAGYLDNINQAGLLQVTAARAALLDQITAARLAELDAANIPADVDGLKTSRDRQLFSMDFWSAPQEEVAIPAVAATLTLPTVNVADLPAGATVVRAIAMLKCRMIENINVAANKLNGATVAATSQVIQVRDDTPGVWRDAIKFADDQLSMAASTREGGDVFIGDTDIAVEVDANDGYNFQYLLAKADLLGINLNDVQVGLRLWYSV